MLPANTQGLTSEKAAILLENLGRNEIVDQARITKSQIFLSQFADPIVWLLIAASGISFLLKEFPDGFMILIIVVLNALFGYIQEFKAEQALSALKQMTVSKTRIIRDGKETIIDSALLVPGDCVLLEQGDKIPADATLVESRNIEVNESILTGESIPVEKDSSKNSLIFMGTVLSRGRGKAIVTTTGMNTRFGKIAATLSSLEKNDSPLQKKVATLGKYLGVAGLLASVLLFIFGLFRHHPIFELLLTSISMAVAAIPEGLPAVITITLAIGTQRMAKKKAILRKLAAIEALGSITIIATDKTGTLTKNEMQVTSWWVNGTLHSGQSKATSPPLETLIDIAAKCNNASLVVHPDHPNPQILGDPTEGALLLFALAHGKNPEEIKEEGTLIEEFEFDSVTKMMSVVWKKSTGKKYHLLTKGAPEELLNKSTHLLTEKGVIPLTEKEHKNIETVVQTLSQEGLRVLAFGFRESDTVSKNREQEEKDLTFVGFVGMSDPPRPEIKAAIARAQEAGVRTIMITGDSPITARAIGHMVGLIDRQGTVITGHELTELSDEQAMDILKTTNVYARIAPEEKLRIVTLLQRLGHVVGVTGDGVNDALALKQADVGVAMGITGSDVAKGAADMVVTDDNYATIVTAIEEGRTIYENMKSSIKYLLGCNIGEVLSITIAVLLGWPMILTPVQILFINLITDGLPALGLAIVPPEKGVMRRKPNNATHLFTNIDIRWLAETGILTTAVILTGFALGKATGNIVLARTLAFTASIFVQQFVYLHLQARSHSILSTFTFKNFLPYIGIIPLILHSLLLYVPMYQQIFSIAAPQPWLLLAVMGISSSPLLIAEIKKLRAS